MLRIQDVNTALEIFEKASINQAEANELGDYKTGNRCYDRYTIAATFLKDQNALRNLQKYLSHSNVGVRLNAAYYLLPTNEQAAISVLENIVKGPGIHSLSAETILSEWRKGNLKF